MASETDAAPGQGEALTRPVKLTSKIKDVNNAETQNQKVCREAFEADRYR